MNRKLSLLLLLAAFTACNNANNTQQKNISAPVITSTGPAAITYSIVNIYPHDTAAFTEGLEYVNGTLYESSGEYGVSDIRKTELTTGKVLQKQPMEGRYFGEGITVFNNKIYQLTYREQTGFVYDLTTLKQERTFSFATREGWGMTHDNTNLIYSDGSDHLYYLDPTTLKQVKQLSITDDRGPVIDINELEFIKGYIYANIWKLDMLIKIDPATGKVVSRVDMNDLRQKIGIDGRPNTTKYAPEVLNGIAYDSVQNRIFITGKYWPKVIEIRLDN